MYSSAGYTAHGSSCGHEVFSEASRWDAEEGQEKQVYISRERAQGEKIWFLRWMHENND